MSDSTERIGPRKIFIAWERLRPIYNLVLIILVLLLLLLDPKYFRHIGLWFHIFFGAITANLCYLAAPAIESYLDWLGMRNRFIRPVLFIAGTIFAAFLALGTVGNFIHPDWLPDQK